MKRFNSCWFACAMFLFLAPIAAGQPATGTPAFGSYSSGPDVINLGNLNSHFAVPVFSKPGRGMPFTYMLSFDSSVWYVPVGTASWAPVYNWGWRAQTEAVTGELVYSIGMTKCFDDPPGWYWGQRYAGFSYHDEFGTVHYSTLHFTSCGNDTGSHIGTVTDGSGYTIDGDYKTVKSPTGQLITPPVNTGTGSATAMDANGNQITASSSGFTDTLGMTALSVSGVAPNPVNLTYTDSSGTARSVTVNYTTATVKTNFGCSGISEYGPTTAYLVSSISYPDGSSYQFTYEPTPGFSGDVTGRVQSITLRTGATITYTYTYTGGNNGIECADGSTAGFSRATADGTSTYSRSGSGTAWTTTVTDASTPGNQAVINFQSATAAGATTVNFYETHRTINQGASTVLLQTDTCYNGATAPCSNTAITTSISEIKSYVTLNSSQQSLTDAFLNSSNLVTELDEYDFGTPTHGALLRKTLTTYASLTNGIVGLPASVTVQDGSGNQAALTTFGYDETSLQLTQSVPQHVAFGGSHGNLTSVHRWVNTGGGSTLTATMTYDDTGNVLTATDPGGHATNFSYADNFSDGIGRGTLAYLTQVNMPDTNSPNLAHHVTKSQYDANTGLPTKVWDQNNNATTLAYDSLLRPTQTNSPDGGQTTITYQSAIQTLVQTKIDSSRSTSHYTLMDGYGRLSRDAVANGESSPYNQQDFCYDSNGRLGFKSYPYQGSGWDLGKVCSGAGDSFTYDAMGRTTSVAHSDGNSVVTTYSGRALQVQDEGNGSGTRVTHVYQRDGLGRTVTACEVSANNIFGIQTMPTCGLDLAGNSNGVTTSYTYDPLGNVTQISQGNLIARQMTYDSLGRLLSEKIPEAGGTTTSYAYNSDSLLTSRTRPSANQAASCIALGTCTTSTTTYTYDELHRLGTTSYVDAASENTPNVVQLYDDPHLGALGGYNVGRLSSAVIENKAFNVAYHWINFAYDVMGRPIADEQSLNEGSHWNNYYVNHTYNLLGLPASSTNGQNVTFTYTYNLAARLTQMTSSLADANHPATLFPAAHYNAGGEVVSRSLGNGVNETFNYDPRWRLLSASATNSSATLYSLGGPGTGGTMTYTPNSRITGATDSVNDNWAYGYDALNRISTASKGTTVDVRFTNDSCSGCGGTPVGGGDRNLFVNSITIGSTVLAPGDPSVSYTPTPCNAYANNVGTLLCNGDMVANMSASGQSVTVSAYGSPDYNVYPHMQVFVNGLLAGEWDVTGTAQNYTASIPGQSSVSLSFDTDRNANRWHQNPSGQGAQASFDNTTNHITNLGVVYDAAGNIINDGVHTYTYDAEHRITQVDSGATATYFYDALGRRARRTVSAGDFEDVYDGAQMVAESRTSDAGWIRGEVYAGSHSATYVNGTTYFSHKDWLGSERVRSDVNGNSAGTCTGNPYGDNYACTGTDPSPIKYAGMEYDSESQLYHTQFRYYNPRLGLWMTPDPAGMAAASLDDPQSFNRYAYVANDPINFVDPTGLRMCQTIPCGGNLGTIWDTGLSGNYFGSGAMEHAIYDGYLDAYDYFQSAWGGGPFAGLVGDSPPCLNPGFMPGGPCIPTTTLAGHLQNWLAALPWNNPCIMSPVSDGCGFANILPVGLPNQALPTLAGRCYPFTTFRTGGCAFVCELVNSEGKELTGAFYATHPAIDEKCGRGLFCPAHVTVEQTNWTLQPSSTAILSCGPPPSLSYLKDALRGWKW